MPRRKSLLAVTVALACLSLAACGSASPESPVTSTQPAASTPSANATSLEAPQPTILDLTGEWKQTNSNATDSWQDAVITVNTIEINWVTDNGDTKSLYWAGSFVPPTAPGDSYSWDSENDHSKTDPALMASGDDIKTFTYSAGVLSWQASALGSTMTVKAQHV